VSHTISCLSQLQQAHYWQRVANGAFQLLLGNGVDVDVRDNDGMSALMWCCHDDRVDHVRLLLNQVGRARLSDADVTGRTCLYWSVRRTEPLRCLQVAVRTYSVFSSNCEIQYCTLSLHLANITAHAHARLHDKLCIQFTAYTSTSAWN